MLEAVSVAASAALRVVVSRGMKKIAPSVPCQLNLNMLARVRPPIILFPVGAYHDGISRSRRNQLLLSGF